MTTSNPSSGRRIVIAIPTYNEKDNILPLLERLSASCPVIDILIVDDNSPDGTAQIVESLKSRWPNLHLLNRPEKLGIGSAHRAAIHWAYDRGYNALATMDADLTHRPEDFPRFLEHLDHGSVVVGSRYLLPGSLSKWNLFRRILTRSGHIMTSFFLKIPYDATGAYRLYNLNQIPRELFSLVSSNGYSFMYESLFILWTNGCTVLEVPIELPARTYGSSKMSVDQIIISVLRLALIYTNMRIAPDLQRLKRRKIVEEAAASSVIPTSPLAPSGWDRYWGGGKKERWTDLLFEVLATWFRVLFIRPQLNRITRQFLQEGESVLHAGCGSGQVDKNVRHWVKLTACDLSTTAVDLYTRMNWPYSSASTADILALPYESASFGAVYNLGVMEHFTEDEIRNALREFHRVIKPGGKVILFWPPKKSPMRFILGAFNSIAKSVDSKVLTPPYPPEISRVESREQGDRWLEDCGFKPTYYEFSFRDLYTQCVFIGQKPL